MIKWIHYPVICLALFAAGLAASWWLAPRPVQEATASPDGSAPPPLSELVPANPAAEMRPGSNAADAPLPVPLRGAPLTAEELFRFGETFRRQQEALKQREASIQQQQARLKLTLDDLQGSRQELDGLRAQLRETVERGERVLQQLEAERNELESRRQELAAASGPAEAAAGSANPSETENVKKISSWLQSMQTDRAADLLRNLSNEGNMDSAVKLLSNLEERNAAKILSAMMASGDPSDTALVAQLTEAFREYQRPTRTAQRNR